MNEIMLLENEVALQRFLGLLGAARTNWRGKMVAKHILVAPRWLWKVFVKQNMIPSE